MVKLVGGEDATRKLGDISASNDAESRYMNEISQNITLQAVDEIKSPLLPES